MSWRLIVSQTVIGIGLAMSFGCSSVDKPGQGLGPVGGLDSQGEDISPNNLMSQSGFPAFPNEGYSGEFSLVHTTSATEEIVNGSSFMLENGDNNGMGTQPGSFVIVPGDTDPVAYAIFGISGFTSDRPVFNAIDVEPTLIPGGTADLPLSYWIGIANYTQYSWEWRGPYTEAQNIALNSEQINDRYVSANGNGELYFAIVTIAQEQNVTPTNPYGLAGVQVNTSTVTAINVSDSSYVSTNPPYTKLEYAGIGGSGGGGKFPSDLDPDTQYVTLEWTHYYDADDPDLEALQYKLYRQGPEDENEYPIGTVNSPQSLYIDPTHSAPGVPDAEEGLTYSYYLRAHNDQGFSAFSSQEFTIPLGWQMVLTADVYEGDSPLTVNFDASGSEPRPDRTIVRYDWNFDWRDPWDDDDFPTEWRDIGTTQQHIYTWPPPLDGDFDVAVKAWDDQGDWEIISVQITLTTIPVAVLEADPQHGDFPLEVMFDAGGSYDPDDSASPGAGIVNYELDFGEGNGWEDFGEVLTVPHTYDTEDGYTARLRVTDDEGSTDISDLRLGIWQGDWWMRGHDPQHTGLSEFTGAQTNDLLWSFLVDGWIVSSPAIGADGTVYVGTENQGLLAVNPDGTEKWSYPTGLMQSSPAIGIDGTIYVGCNDDNIYAIKPDGNLSWTYPTGADVQSSPVIGSDGTIFVGCVMPDSMLYAINADGSLKWSYSIDWVYSSPALGSDGTVYVGGGDNKLHAINPDGSLNWMFPADGTVWSSPSVGSDGTIYVGSGDYKLYAINSDGTLGWSYATTGPIHSSPAIGTDGTIYIGSNDTDLYAINPDGTLDWSYSTGHVVLSSPAVGSDGVIYFGSNDDKFYALNPDGSMLWSYTTAGDVESSAAIGPDGTVYVGGMDNYLYAFGAE